MGLLWEGEAYFCSVWLQRCRELLGDTFHQGLPLRFSYRADDAGKRRGRECYPYVVPCRRSTLP
jgi:hypothetical protein